MGSWTYCRKCDAPLGRPTVENYAEGFRTCRHCGEQHETVLSLADASDLLGQLLDAPADGIDLAPSREAVQAQRAALGCGLPEALLKAENAARLDLQRLAADECARADRMRDLLTRARWYVTDALDAHEHSDGRDLLKEIDAALRWTEEASQGEGE